MRHVYCAFVILGLLSGCNRAEKDQTTLSFSLGDIGAQSTSGLSDMNCFGVFVSVPETESRVANKCSYATNESAKASGFTYSLFYGTFYREKGMVGSSLSIEVPNGENRVLRLIGANVDTNEIDKEKACLGYFRKYVSSFYNIAESQPLSLKGEDLAVDLTAVYDTSKEIPVASCTAFNSSEVPGVPTRIAVNIQDDRPDQKSKLISSANCVGVRFQIQDAYGTPTGFNAAINADVIETVDGTSIGNFYYPTASASLDLCAAVNLAPVISGKISLNFAAGTKEKILYFRPHSSGLAKEIKIGIEAPGTSLSAGYDKTYYTLPVRVATKYAFYDLFNNISSVKSNLLYSPAVIKRSECRFGAIQFLDQFSVPLQATTSIMTPDTIRVTSVPSGVVEFFTSQSACASNSGPTLYKDISMASSTSATGFGFFYRVTAGAPSAISFEVKNRVMTPYPVISSGDLSSSSNVWRIAD